MPNANTRLRNDKGIVMAAVNQNGLALRHASGRLCNDLGVVMMAVAQDGWALQFASERFRASRRMMMPLVSV